jgi:xanthine dehydrogenase YagT iron-sulfur-binding subunit
MKKKKDRRRAAAPRSSTLSRRSFIHTMGLAGAAATLPLSQGCGSLEPGVEIPEEGLGPGPVELSLTVNGEAVKLKAEPRTTLLDALRDHLKLGSADPIDLTGAKRVCDRGSCGACTVMIGGRIVYSCTTLAVEAQGKDIRTVEGLQTKGTLHPVQQEFVACDGLMCGFCTPGFVISGVACLERNPNASREEIRKALDGNICRCGTQVRALEACEKAARRMKERR